jgi:hypothetical protein
MRACLSRVAIAVAAVLVCGVCAASVFGLPAGRAYEMVSPLFKGGFGVLHIEAVALDGESVAFYSPGTFAGALASGVQDLGYVASRGPSGWLTLPFMPPAEVMPYVVSRDVTPDLNMTLAFGKSGANNEAAFQEATSEGFFLHSVGESDDAGSWGLAGQPLKRLDDEPLALLYDGGSADFCHLFVVPQNSNEILAPEVSASLPQVYEFDPGCGGASVSLHAVALNSVNRLMSPTCVSGLGTSIYSLAQSEFNAVAADGEEAFFTTCVNGNADEHQVFVRLGGEKTLEVSKPLGPACGEPCKEGVHRVSADFVGASEDGSDVFFVTKASLVPEDTDTGNDLYMARIGCPDGEAECEVADRVVTSITQVSHDPNSAPAEVQGVVRVAPDGERVYFVARGDLLEAARQETLESEGDEVPRVGADNLYFYNSVTGRIGFVTDLCSGFEVSGLVDDSRCPNATESDIGLWVGGNASEAQTAGPGGEFLVFSSVARLTSDDTNALRDVYRYDALTGEMDRVSHGEAGYDANGNGEGGEGDARGATITLGHRGGSVLDQYELDDRAVSEDGSRVVFTTSEPLSPAASNGLANVYEWHKEPGQSEGTVSLISSGSGDSPVESPVISPDGINVFFITSVGLVPQDTDGAPDLYDARIGGGFPRPAAEPEPCAGDACQGPLTNPAPLLVPGSVSQAAGEDYAPKSGSANKTVAKAKKSKAKAKVRKAKATGKKRGRARKVRRGFVIGGQGR